MLQFFQVFCRILAHEADQQVAVHLVVVDDLMVQAEAMNLARAAHMGARAAAFVQAVSSLMK